MGFGELIESAIDFFGRHGRADLPSSVETKSIETKEETLPQIPINFSLKILAISDTHGCLHDAELIGKDADVCLLLGDLSASDMLTIKRNMIAKAMSGADILISHDSPKKVSWDG